MPDYKYPDAGPSKQNVYRGTIPLKLDDRCCVAITFMTRGIDDTFLEDPVTGHILVYLNRLGGGPGADGPMTYEIEVQ